MRYTTSTVSPARTRSPDLTRSIKPLPKKLRFDSAEVREMAGKTEGIALLGDGSLLLINDDGFGIAGGRTQIVLVRGTGIARTEH